MLRRTGSLVLQTRQSFSLYPRQSTSFPPVLTRSYASKSKNSRHIDPPSTVAEGKSPSSTKKGGDKSSGGASDPEIVEHKMRLAVDWYRKEVAALEARAVGRVTPALLDSVRVSDDKGAAVKLNEVATVGVREGSTLIVTLFDEAMMKPVEYAIYAAKIPHVVPQRVDTTTLRIPIAKPTTEDKLALAASASKLSEKIRIQVRMARENGMKELKNMGLNKHSSSAGELEKLTTKYIEEIDTIAKKAKKDLS